MTAQSNDCLHRFIFENTDIRGKIVGLDQSLKEINDLHHYPAAIARLLGEFLAAASLLSSTLKFDGILTIQARGSGDLSLMMAEVSHQKKIRGLAQFTDGAALEGRSLSSLIGKGVLSIIIDPDKGKRYQGIVPLEHHHLAECLEDYFQQSEQLPTKLWLHCDGNKAGGLMLQRLPQQVASEEVNTDTWETQVHLANTSTNEELLELVHETLLTRLFHESDVRLFDPVAIRFGCSCSKERSSNALKRMEKGELKAIIKEEGRITVDCHFCGYQYTYNNEDIDTLFAPKRWH